MFQTDLRKLGSHWGYNNDDYFKHIDQAFKQLGI